MNPAPPVTRTRSGVYSAVVTDIVLVVQEDAVGLAQRFEGAGVRPSADADIIRELASLDVDVVHRGDLQLAPVRGAYAPDDVEELIVVEVEAHDRERALRAPRLLLDLDDLV